ncbi:MAG: acyltransferase [Acidimicrobiales bacterium]
MAATTSSGGDAPLPGARPAATPRASMPYFPALDGIRALAVAAVLCFHGGFSWAEGGYLGVSTFFTLSGFLITSLLLTEHRSTGAIDRKAFWSRRFRRLMPTALAGMVITTVYGATVATSDQRANLAGDTTRGVDVHRQLALHPRGAATASCSRRRHRCSTSEPGDRGAVLPGLPDRRRGVGTSGRGPPGPPSHGWRRSSPC